MQALVTHVDGSQSTVTANLQQEGGRWLIIGFNINKPLTPQKTATP